VRPPAGIVRSPADGHARIPDVTIRGLVPPIAVAVQRPRVRPGFGRKILRGNPEPLIPPRLGPLIEPIPRGRIEDIGDRRRQPRLCERAFAREQIGRSVFVDEIRRAAEDGELDLGAAFAGNQRHAVFTRLANLDPGGGRVDPECDLPARAGDVQSYTPLEEPDHLVGLEVDNRVVIHVERAALGVEDFDATGARAKAIAGEQRHRAGRVVRDAIALEDGGAFDERNVGGRLPGGVLRVRRRARQKQGPQEPHDSRKRHDGGQAGHRNLRERVVPELLSRQFCR
jgi:hypothetical protein